MFDLTIRLWRVYTAHFITASNSIMTEQLDTTVDTCEDLMDAFDQAIGADNSDDSQIAGLKGLSLEGPPPLGTLRPHSRRRKLLGQEILRKPRKRRRPLNKAKGPPNKVAYRPVPAPALVCPSWGLITVPQSFYLLQMGPGKPHSWFQKMGVAPRLSHTPVRCLTCPLWRGGSLR